MAQVKAESVAEEISKIQQDMLQFGNVVAKDDELNEKEMRLLELEGKLNVGEGEIYSGVRKTSS